MLSAVAIVGTFVLIGLAVTVGVLDGRSRRAGWSRLADQRRRQSARSRALDEREEALAAESRELWEWEGQLIRAAEGGGCAVCELRRQRGERPAS
jgi:hypothetical protein